MLSGREKLIILGSIIIFYVNTFAQNIITIGDATSSFIGEYDSTYYIESQAGFTLTKAGDLNKDKYQDFFIGAPGSDYKQTNTGKIYIVTGNTSYNASEKLASQNSSIIGHVNYASLGRVIASDGDLNKDGYNDYVFGLPYKGLVTVNLGSSNLPTQNVSVSSSSASFQDTSNSIYLGFSTSINGDINGDGYDDLIIGAPKANTSKTSAGKIYIYYGSSSISGTYTDLSVLPQFLGENESDQAGYSVSIIPDINRDGYDDILIGTYQANTLSGKAYLIYGKNSKFSGEINLSEADAIFTGATTGELFGLYVTGLGDLNGDGYNDFAITAPNGGSNNQGHIYLFYGQAEKYQGNYSSSSANAILQSDYEADHAGENSAVASAGDINGDLLDDLIIGAYRYNLYKGRAYIFYGTTTPLSGSVSLSKADIIINGSNAGESVGYAVSSAGDTNYDGIDEYLIGIPNATTNGRNDGKVVFFKLRSNTTPNATTSISILDENSNPITQATNTQKLIIRCQANDPNTSTTNIAFIKAYSDSETTPIIVRLKETSINSGIYEGPLYIVRSRSSEKSRQQTANLSNTLTIESYNNSSIKDTISIVNAPPSANITSAYQLGNGSSTKVVINYKLWDYDLDLCNFISNSDQIQYKKSSETTWHTASISGQTSNIASEISGKNHNINSEPLYINIGDVTDTYDFRIKPHDGTTYASNYATIQSINIDNTPPSAPIFSSNGNKFAYSITVTGSAEANSLVSIYVGSSLAKTVTANTNSFFSASGINVSSTQNILYATCTDQAGNKSVTSNALTITFGDYHQTLNNNTSSLEITIPFNATNIDSPVTFNIIPTTSIQATNGAPPTNYYYITGFDLNLETPPTSISDSITVTISITEDISVTESVQIYFWNGSAWTQTNVTLNSVTKTESKNIINFSTSNLGRFVITNLTDPSGPIISNLYINSTPIQKDNYYSQTPTISATIQDLDSTISSYSYSIMIKSSNQAYTTFSKNNLSSKILNIAEKQTTSLPSNEYYLKLQAWDSSGNSSSATSPSFKVGSSILKLSALQAPNPYNPSLGNLTIGYNLSLPANISIYIVNLSGNILKKWSFSSSDPEASIGDHLLTWNGQTSTGEIISNGLYYGFIVATHSNQKAKTKLKIAVIR